MPQRRLGEAGDGPDDYEAFCLTQHLPRNRPVQKPHNTSLGNDAIDVAIDEAGETQLIAAVAYGSAASIGSNASKRLRTRLCRLPAVLLPTLHKTTPETGHMRGISRSGATGAIQSLRSD